MGKTIKKVLFALATVFMIACLFLEPFTGLDVKGMRFLGLFVWWIVLMVCEYLPNYMACFAGCVLAIAFGCADFATTFKEFGSSTAILLIGAFGIATALGNSGLLNRLALYVMKIFPGTYKGQVWAVAIASIVIAPTIPSTTAKCAIIIPVVNTICDEMGYEPSSKGAVGLISVCNTVTNCNGIMFMTGGIVAALMLSFYPGSINFVDYFLFALVWGVVLFLGTVFFHLFYYNPDKGAAKEDIKSLDKAVIEERIAALGKMQKKEIVALVVLLITVALWILEKKHGIPTQVVAVGAWTVLCCFDLFSVPEFNSGKMMWSVWAMVGTVLGFVGLLSATGVSAWIGGLVAPVVTVLAGSPALLILGLSILTSLLMMALVNYMIFGALALALLANVPMDMLCVVFPIFVSGTIFILPPQNVCVLAAEGLAGGRMKFNDLRPAAVAFVVTNLVAIACSIPWWSILGYIY